MNTVEKILLELRGAPTELGDYVGSYLRNRVDDPSTQSRAVMTRLPYLFQKDPSSYPGYEYTMKSINDYSLMFALHAYETEGLERAKAVYDWVHKCLYTEWLKEKGYIF